MSTRVQVANLVGRDVHQPRAPRKPVQPLQIVQVVEKPSRRVSPLHTFARWAWEETRTPRLLAVARLLVLNPSFRCAGTSATAASIFPVLASGSGLNVTAYPPSVLDDVVASCPQSLRRFSVIWGLDMP